MFKCLLKNCEMFSCAADQPAWTVQDWSCSTKENKYGRIGSKIVVQARRAGLHMKISHSSEGDARFCKQSKKDNKTEIRESEGWGQNEVKTYEIA